MVPADETPPEDEQSVELPNEFELDAQRAEAYRAEQIAKQQHRRAINAALLAPMANFNALYERTKARKRDA